MGARRPIEYGEPWRGSSGKRGQRIRGRTSALSTRTAWATRRTCNAAFARLPAGSWFVNIGRGPIVDTDALVAALESGHLAGAALDVTDPEPLPADHVLWTMDNVIITPHVASTASLTGERRWNIIRENVRRFATGDDFVNVVDKKTGY